MSINQAKNILKNAGWVEVQCDTGYRFETATQLIRIDKGIAGFGRVMMKRKEIQAICRLMQ